VADQAFHKKKRLICQSQGVWGYENKDFLCSFVIDVRGVFNYL